MMRYKLFLILFMISCCLSAFAETNWAAEEAKARSLYDAGKYDQSIVLFREILLSSKNETIKREAYFWLGKAYMSVEKYNQAMTNLEYYLANYQKNGSNYPEAVYQKGVLLYMQEQYEAAYQQLAEFAKTYKKDKLVSSAYFWMGESMYALGQLDNAELYYGVVVKKFPRSSKFQAAQYKLDLIEHKRAELVLQNLLKWSQEQYLATLNQNKVKEKSLLQALEEYRRRELLSDENMLNASEIVNLKTENEQLKKKVEDQAKEIDDMVKIMSKEKDVAAQLEQIRLKQQLLSQKEEALRIYEKKLNERERISGTGR